jgi:hypothetical protein
MRSNYNSWVFDPLGFHFVLLEPLFRPVIELGGARALVRRYFLRMARRHWQGTR